MRLPYIPSELIILAIGVFLLVSVILPLFK